LSDESAMFCHCSRYEVAASCGGNGNYISAVEDDKATYIKLFALFVIFENSEDLRRSLDRDDRLYKNVGSRW